MLKKVNSQINYGFWAKLNKPFFAMAPMADVADEAFRKIIIECGKPDVFFSEFVSVSGLCSPGRKRLLLDLKFSEKEHPIVAQFFGTDPEKFHECAGLASKLGFDGIDINMGCPDRSIIKQGAGSSLIRRPDLAKEIIAAAKEGSCGLPVSVKTRIGYSKNTIEEWITTLLEALPCLITIHGRTKTQMYSGTADWSAIRQAVLIAEGTGVMIIGNGDVKNLDQARELYKETGVDGIMLGRSVMGNPWLFNKSLRKNDLDIKEVLKVLIRHSEVFEETYDGVKKFHTMRKHLKSYVAGFDGAKTLRMNLMKAESSEDVKRTVEEFLSGKMG